METLTAPEKIRSSSAETTLESLKAKETELAARLEDDFPDDKEYFAALAEAHDVLAKARSSYLSGVDRARLVVIAEKILNKAKMFERGRASSAFEEASRRREGAQEEIWEIQKEK